MSYDIKAPCSFFVTTCAKDAKEGKISLSGIDLDKVTSVYIYHKSQSIHLPFRSSSSEIEIDLTKEDKEKIFKLNPHMFFVILSGDDGSWYPLGPFLYE
jgi:hypothetical protein